MILVTCVIAPWQVDRYGRRLAQNLTSTPEPLTVERQRILVALAANAPNRHLLDLAMLLRQPELQQPIYPATVVQDIGNTAAQVSSAEKVLGDAVIYLSLAGRGTFHTRHPHRSQPRIRPAEGAP